ncbi:hypothetical protein VXG46_000092 [Acinetobacter baumannii]|uniref:Uncharacterized protein n=1 Tax=Acinetobacter baumannii TaxID=470 RepID=A0A505M9S7_ACIBA|nr:hypothetical protein [Acinetobacter baumannii]EJB8494390.1 hypothetical protein [Acinetobacter baumannii]ELB0343125.1 hypothetical protein [Acinetobacter baumannii]EMC7949642.1 hypothetical protein [Acinetobacter baumannii]EMD9690996.1 hypothetical protein [Acinetobacter baumannii]MCJ8819290.1 hypothetical protein [Acinetobacter baumannii]
MTNTSMINEIKKHLQIIDLEFEDDRLTNFLNENEINISELKKFIYEIKKSTILSEEYMSIEFSDSVNKLCEILNN